MPFAIPKWNAHRVKEWDDLIVVTEEESRQLNAASVALLNYMPIIGITELEVDNIDDAWRRIAITQALYGSFVYEDEGTYKKPLFFTKSDIERHIGAESEGKQLTFEEFCRNIEGRKYLETNNEELPSFIANGNRA
jgi:hypothetical protein